MGDLPPIPPPSVKIGWLKLVYFGEGLRPLDLTTKKPLRGADIDFS